MKIKIFFNISDLKSVIYNQNYGDRNIFMYVTPTVAFFGFVLLFNRLRNIALRKQ